MAMTEDKGQATTMKYLDLMKMISIMENRLVRTETVYLILNVFIFFISIIWLILLRSSDFLHLSKYLGSSFLLFWLVVGLFICILWITFAMRLQLKLKLRYFQARYLERKMDVAGESFFSDEEIFFNRKIRKIESLDEKELLEYPSKGFTAMDGFIGAAKPRYLSWILPILFTALYLVAFFYALFSIMI